VPRRPPAGSTDLTERLIKLRAEGRKNAEIAATLGVPLTRIVHEIGGLIQTGAVSSRRGLLWSSADAWVKGRERTRADVAPEVARLYMREDTYEEIGLALALTPHQVHNTLTKLFAEGMPKRKPHTLTDEQARAVHAAHAKGQGTIKELAQSIGFSDVAVRKRMHKLDLPAARPRGRPPKDRLT
jgi:DNA-binding CsgD family transcriptional regulator